MKEKIRAALIYHKNSKFFSGKHFDNTFYNFFFKAWRRNDSLEITYFPTEQIFDASKLKGKFDIIFLWANFNFEMPDEITGIHSLEIPVIAKCGDPVDSKNAIKYHEKWKIDYYVSFFPKDFFYELYPKNFKFKTLIYGVEPSLFENTIPFEKRIKNKILLTGATGNKKIISRIINDFRTPKWNAYRFYHLRTKCTELPFVDYTPTLNHKYTGDLYPRLLEQYAASIAATTYNANIKYWENAASGCLTFMEITEKNRGNFLGYRDGENCVVINEKNYKEKFNEYISDYNNPKWKEIAQNGREFTLKNYTNDTAVESLVELMKNLL